MVLGFKTHFPDGNPTRFFEKIMAGIVSLEFIRDEEKKIHSIREGERWKPGMSIQMAFGVRTPAYKQFNKGIPALELCKRVQSIVMDYDPVGDKIQVYIDGKKIGPERIKQLINNDGLRRERFVEWFFSKSTTFSGQIVHWTDFKY